MIRVAIADDDLLVREGIEHVLAAAASVDVVAVTADYDAVMAAVERDAPDVVVTDIRMPPQHADEGVRVALELRKSHPAIGVIVISHHIEPEYALALLADGAARRGYLLKDRIGDRERLVTAIEEVAAGGSVIDPVVVETLVTSRNRGDESPLRLLTPRELEVLSQIASGKSNAAIARSLVITKRGVERHIGAIFSKLNLPDEEETSRRVTAALLFLAEHTPRAPST